MKINFKRQKLAVTFIEVMIALLILGVFLLPVFGYLTSSVSDIEKIYTEAYAISRAKFIMDGIMFQIPYRAIIPGVEAGAPCEFGLGEEAEEGSYKAIQDKSISELLDKLIKKMFGDEAVLDAGKKWKGEGKFKNSKGYIYKVKVQVSEYKDESLPYLELPARQVIKAMPIKDIEKSEYLVKKIVLQIIWGKKKGEEPDPMKDKNLQSLFLVSYKSNLD